MLRYQDAREVPEDASVIEQAKVALATDWPHLLVMDIDQRMFERAGEFADIFALRGYDSIQLAAGFEAGRLSQTPILFACYDLRLNKPAKLLGMSCL